MSLRSLMVAIVSNNRRICTQLFLPRSRSPIRTHRALVSPSPRHCVDHPETIVVCARGALRPRVSAAPRSEDDVRVFVSRSVVPGNVAVTSLGTFCFPRFWPCLTNLFDANTPNGGGRSSVPCRPCERLKDSYCGGGDGAVLAALGTTRTI